MEIKGDCFIGRAFDDEREEWERRDFPVADASADARWVAQAKAANSGKNLSSYRTSGIQQQMLGGGGSSGGLLTGNKHQQEGQERGQEQGANGYLSFTESSEEVEVRFSLPTGCTAGALAVAFGARKLSVRLKSGETLADVHSALQSAAGGADLAGPIIKDDSTWAVAIEGGKPVLTVTMAKVEGSPIWRHFLVT